jgi:Skp family chaperone for outer membrane proteins
MSVRHIAQKTTRKKYNAIFDKSIVLYANIWYNKANAVLFSAFVTKNKGVKL